MLYKIIDPICGISISDDTSCLLLNNEITKLISTEEVNRESISLLEILSKENKVKLCDVLLKKYFFLYESNIIVFCLTENEFNKTFISIT